mmetsp:Transcript_13596/g.39655  ORF Transcript_13596/g.39655 Transcript_13596/m.39655 type:complete len:193 (-) Transcript_13596:3668-4246(-)
MHLISRLSEGCKRRWEHSLVVPLQRVRTPSKRFHSGTWRALLLGNQKWQRLLNTISKSIQSPAAALAAFDVSPPQASQKQTSIRIHKGPSTSTTIFLHFPVAELETVFAEHDLQVVDLGIGGPSQISDVLLELHHFLLGRLRALCALFVSTSQRIQHFRHIFGLCFFRLAHFFLEAFNFGPVLCFLSTNFVL